MRDWIDFCLALTSFRDVSFKQIFFTIVFPLFHPLFRQLLEFNFTQLWPIRMRFWSWTLGIFGIFRSLMQIVTNITEKGKKFFYGNRRCFSDVLWKNILYILFHCDMFKSSFEIQFSKIERHKKKKTLIWLIKTLIITFQNLFFSPVERTLLESFSRIATVFFSFTASLEKPLIPRSYSLLPRNPRIRK